MSEDAVERIDHIGDQDVENVQRQTFFQHSHFETLHEAAGLTRLAPPLGDLALVGGRTAILDVTCRGRSRRHDGR